MVLKLTDIAKIKAGTLELVTPISRGLTEVHTQCTPTVNARFEINYIPTFKIRQNG
jgi:hypothetical protein